MESSCDVAALFLFTKYLSRPLKKQDFSGIIALQFTALRESYISPDPDREGGREAAAAAGAGDTDDAAAADSHFSTELGTGSSDFIIHYSSSLVLQN